MQKSLLLLSAVLFIVLFGHAQSAPSSVISAQGGFAKSDNISLEWTLGETVASTTSLPFAVYTQGFNQSFLILAKKGSNEGKDLITVFAAPNPVTANLNVSIKTTVASRYAVVLTDMNGVKVYQKTANLASQQLSIDLRGFAGGAYLLQVSDAANQIIHISKIVKL